MIRYLSKRMVYALSLLLFMLYVGYSLPAITDLKDTVVREYFSHKEFLFNLKNAPRVRKEPAQEEDLQRILSEIGVEPEKILKTESGMELQISELSWEKLPHLIKELEGRYEVVSFSAVDNTGKGIFEVRIVVR